MIPWIAVAVGGALGSLARYGVTTLAERHLVSRFPWGTFVVNVLGCVVAGVLAGLVVSGRLSMRDGWREFAFVGLLGGFTTFSAFSLETITLMRSGEGLLAVVNVAAQVALGLVGLYAGLRIAMT